MIQKESIVKTFIWWLLLLGSISQLAQVAGQILSEELKSTRDGQLFYVELEIGHQEETRRSFKLLVSTGYYMTWLATDKVNPSSGYNGTFNGYQGANFDILTTGGRYGDYDYAMQNDTWQFGSQRVHEQQFAIVYPYLHGLINRDLFGDYEIDGMLGLSGYGGQPKGALNLFMNLHKLGHIQRLQFSLYINKTALDDDDHHDDDHSHHSAGALVFGGIDQRYFRGEFKYANLVEDLNQSGSLYMNSSLVVSGQVQLDWSRTNEWTKSRDELQRLMNSEGRINLEARPSRLKLDSTTKLFVGPWKLLDLIHLDFIGAIKIGLGHLYAFNDCQLDNKPDIVFLVDGIEFKLTPGQYVVEHKLDGQTVCLSALLGHHYGQRWIFGTRFLRNYYTLFDFENNLVGFAEPI